VTTFDDIDNVVTHSGHQEQDDGGSDIAEHGHQRGGDQRKPYSEHAMHPSGKGKYDNRKNYRCGVGEVHVPVRPFSRFGRWSRL